MDSNNTQQFQIIFSKNIPLSSNKHHHPWIILSYYKLTIIISIITSFSNEYNQTIHIVTRPQRIFVSNPFFYSNFYYYTLFYLHCILETVCSCKHSTSLRISSISYSPLKLNFMPSKNASAASKTTISYVFMSARTGRARSIMVDYTISLVTKHLCLLLPLVTSISLETDTLLLLPTQTVHI